MIVHVVTRRNCVHSGAGILAHSTPGCDVRASRFMSLAGVVKHCVSGTLVLGCNWIEAYSVNGGVSLLS